MLPRSHMTQLKGLVLGMLLTGAMSAGASKDLGNGFRDHGVATPVSNHRETVATRNGQGHAVGLIWLFDHRGGYALLMVDVDTGTCRQIAAPFPFGGDCPYASLLSSRNRYYTHVAGHFVELDPEKRAFTFWRATERQMAMGMTEDDAGRIWSVTYPNSGVACYDPEFGEFRDYGWVRKENWARYQRHMAADDAGWVYFGLGNTASQIVALNPETGESTKITLEYTSDGAHMMGVAAAPDGTLCGGMGGFSTTSPDTWRALGKT